MSDVTPLHKALFETQNEKEIQYLFLMIEGVEKGARFPKSAYHSGEAAKHLNRNLVRRLGEAIGAADVDVKGKGGSGSHAKGKKVAKVAKPTGNLLPVKRSSGRNTRSRCRAKLTSKEDESPVLTISVEASDEEELDAFVIPTAVKDESPLAALPAVPFDGDDVDLKAGVKRLRASSV